MFKPNFILTIFAIAAAWYITIAVIYTTIHLTTDLFR